MYEFLAIIAIVLFCLGGCGDISYNPETNETDFEKVTKPI